MKPIKIEDIQNPEVRKQIEDKLKGESECYIPKLDHETTIKINLQTAETEIISQRPIEKEVLTFDIEPKTAPRLTRRDAIFLDPNHKDPKKRQRPTVTRYFEYKLAIKKICEDNNFKLPPILNICFVIPMPDSWSLKKKKEMNGKPNIQTPDIDNLLKAFMDSYGENDSYVWKVQAKKVWGVSGKILVQRTS